jgi:hypothetical protein
MNAARVTAYKRDKVAKSRILRRERASCPHAGFASERTAG